MYMSTTTHGEHLNKLFVKIHTKSIMIDLKRDYCAFHNASSIIINHKNNY